MNGWTSITDDPATWPPDGVEVMFAVTPGWGELRHRIATRTGGWVEDQEANSDLFSARFYKAWTTLPDLPR